MARLRAVTFDAAGTLFTVVEPVGETYARFASHHGDRLDVDGLRRGFACEFPCMPPLAFVGLEGGALEQAERNWWRELVRRVVAHAGRVARFQAYFDALYAYYAEPRAWRLYPEVRVLIETLRRRGLKLAVVSNFDSRLLPVLAGLGVDACFDTIVYSSAAGSAKPDAGIFELALDRLSVAPCEAVHIGDNPTADYHGARNAGLDALLVERDSVQHRQHSVSNLDALLELAV